MGSGSHGVRATAAAALLLGFAALVRPQDTPATDASTTDPSLTFPASGGGSARLTVTLPPYPSTAAITGTITNLPSGTSPTAYKAVVYVMDSSSSNAVWGPKSGVPLSSSSFTIGYWATDPNDVNAAGVLLLILPAAAATPRILGTQPTADYLSQAVAYVRAPRGQTSSNSGSPPAPAPAPGPVNPSGPASVTATVPAVGSRGDVVGKVIGLSGAQLTGAMASIYLRAPNGQWWGAKATAPCSPVDGSFGLTGWQSDPNDINAPAVQLVITGAGVLPPTVLGGALPATFLSSALASKVIERAGGAPAPVTPPVGPAPVTPPSGGGGTTPAAGESPWPPTADPGPKQNPGGALQFAGYRWQIKDSGGGGVGPGPNVFVGNNRFVWTDAWGMHMNVRPRSGCSGWASSELILDHPLGYGTYLFSTVSPMEYLDPEVVVGLFLWDDSGNANNGWREIDFEYARWGNGGDPTSSQYVLMPLKPGNSPGWRVRWYTRQMGTIGGERGNQGGGGCDDPGQENGFNGAAVNKATCVVKWFAGSLRWYCWEGLWTMQTLPGAVGTARLLASYTYPAPQYVPDPGRNQWHFNIWQANSGAPRWGRRVHTTITNFQFTTDDANIGNWPGNSGLSRLLLEEQEASRQVQRSLVAADAHWLEQQLEGSHLSRKERESLRAHCEELRRIGEEEKARGGGNTSAILDWLSTLPESPEHRRLMASYETERGLSSRVLQEATPARYSCGDPHTAMLKASGVLSAASAATPPLSAGGAGAGGGAGRASTVSAVLGTLGALAGVSLLVAGAVVVNNRRRAAAAGGGGVGGTSSLSAAASTAGRKVSDTAKSAAAKVRSAGSQVLPSAGKSSKSGEGQEEGGEEEGGEEETEEEQEEAEPAPSSSRASGSSAGRTSSRK